MKRDSLIALRLFNERVNKLYTIEKLSTLSNISVKEYKAYEKGKMIPSDEALEKIASALEIDLSRFKRECDPYENIELDTRRKNRILKYIQIVTLAFLAIFLWFIIELASTPKESSLFEVYDSKGYKYIYEINSSNLFSQGEVTLLSSDNTKDIDIPEVVTKYSGTIPNSYKVTAVNLAGLQGNVSIPKSISRILKYEYDSITEKNGYILLVPNVKGIKVALDNPYFDSREDCNCIIETSTNKLIAASMKDAFIPNSVTEITTASFNCNLINDLEIPASVKKIDSFAFCNCSGLRDFKFNEGLEEICDFAFFDETGGDFFDLTYEINLPSTIKKVSALAFPNETKMKCYIPCDNLASILYHNYKHIVFDGKEYWELNIGYTYEYLTFDSINGRVNEGGITSATKYIYTDVLMPTADVFYKK